MSVVKVYDRLDLSRVQLDGVLRVASRRADAVQVAKDHRLPVQSVTRAHDRFGFWFYVFQLRGDPVWGTVTLAGTEPGFNNAVRLPVRQLQTGTQAMPLHEMAALLAAVDEDYPACTVTGHLAAALTKILDLWADARRNGRREIDLRDLDRAVASEFAPAVHAWRMNGAGPRVVGMAWDDTP
ncbi:hypothetical protein [Saccharopolyspora sp. SCSIO 74807]|uniref:hypothetical protein n=1 Tax=Saccharopolyspora sp. SCSIO 74807 TaxID=3118084 RepID=UPI0030D1B91A